MNGFFSILSAIVVAAHIAFVTFAALGGVLALLWPRVAWVHLPAVAWAVFVELTGRPCPLTPLENALRQRGGLDEYSGDFVARYLFPVLYPEGLTRDAQTTVGLLLLTVNTAIYMWVLWRRKERRHRGPA